MEGIDGNDGSTKIPFKNDGGASKMRGWVHHKKGSIYVALVSFHRRETFRTSGKNVSMVISQNGSSYSTVRLNSNIKMGSILGAMPYSSKLP